LKRRSGIQALPTLAAPRVLIIPKLFRLPMKALAVWEKVKEYPQKNHYVIS